MSDTRHFPWRFPCQNLRWVPSEDDLSSSSISSFPMTLSLSDLNRDPKQRRSQPFRYFWHSSFLTTLPLSELKWDLKRRRKLVQTRIKCAKWFMCTLRFLLSVFSPFNCIVPLGFLPWEIRVAFPEESQLRVALPELQCILGVFVFPQSPELWHGLQGL